MYRSYINSTEEHITVHTAQQRSSSRRLEPYFIAVYLSNYQCPFTRDVFVYWSRVSWWIPRSFVHCHRVCSWKSLLLWPLLWPIVLACAGPMLFHTLQDTHLRDLKDIPTASDSAVRTKQAINTNSPVFLALGASRLCLAFAYCTGSSVGGGQSRGQTAVSYYNVSSYYIALRVGGGQSSGQTEVSWKFCLT